MVTGANAGVGYEAARALAGKGAKVILACRSLERGSQALEKIKKQHPSADATVMVVDLAVQQNIREFALRFREQHDRLDVLLNNAGVMIPPFTRTVDGFELQMGVNHFGHFTLTGMLLELLLKTGSSRIVTVSSGAHQMGSRNWDDLHYEKKRYISWRAYGQSKMSNLWFAYELQRRLASGGHQTVSVAAHPGFSATNLQRHMGFFKFMNVLAQRATMGALPLLYACVSEDVSGGDYYGPDKWREMRGYPSKVHSNSLSYDPEVSSEFWTLSEDSTGCFYIF